MQYKDEDIQKLRASLQRFHAKETFQVGDIVAYKKGFAYKRSSSSGIYI